MVRSAAVFVVALGVVAQAGQQHAHQTQHEPILKTGVSAVVIDAVVRDAKARPVTDLRKEDFQLFEDGVEQSIGDVTVVGVPPRSVAGEVAAAEGQPTAHPLTPTESAARQGASFLAIVFDRLTPEARGLAYKGALACVDTLREGDFVGVFLSDLSLKTIQPYTNDRDRIRTAIREAASRATAVFDRTTMREDLKEYDPLANPLEGDAHPSVPEVASPEFEGRPVEGRTSLRRLMDSLQLTTHMSWEAISRDHQGYATTNALLAITSGLSLLPGRKAVVFFAEALSIPDAVLPHFQSVVTTANRGNVSVYTVDTAGLRVHSQDMTTAREVTAMAAKGLDLGLDGSNASSLAMLERNEDVLRKDPRTSLTMLAEQTGGFLVEHTNDLANAFRRIDADRRFHYLLTYTPRNTEVDGTWRSVTVKVPTRNVTVRARSGYLAIRSGSTLPILAYEGPALAALERSPAPRDLPVRATALVFPRERHSEVVVLAATNAAALRFDRDDAKQLYRTDFSILARIVDETGRTVRKSSQPYRLSGPVAQLAQVQRGEVLFYKQPALTPGLYTLEVAIHDALARRASVHRLPFVVPASTGQPLRVSSLVLVSRAEHVRPEDRQPDNPLYVGEALIYPNLGEPVRKSSSKALTFFVQLHAPPGVTPTASMEIESGGTRLAQGPLALPAASPAGRIDHVLQVPADALPPAGYTLRLIVTHADQRETREAAFQVTDGAGPQ